MVIKEDIYGHFIQVIQLLPSNLVSPNYPSTYTISNIQISYNDVCHDFRNASRPVVWVFSLAASSKKSPFLLERTWRMFAMEVQIVCLFLLLSCERLLNLLLQSWAWIYLTTFKPSSVASSFSLSKLYSVSILNPTLPPHDLIFRLSASVY